jgi:hypothetical protein
VPLVHKPCHQRQEPQQPMGHLQGPRGPPRVWVVVTIPSKYPGRGQLRLCEPPAQGKG